VKGPSNGRVTGFGLTGGAVVDPTIDAAMQNVLIRGSKASRCLALNGGGVRGFGVFAEGGNPNQPISAILFENCVSSRNEVNLGLPAWSGAVTYPVGVRVLSGGLIFVSLNNGNLNNLPAAPSTAWWSVINTAPAAYSLTTTYALGALVSYTESTGQTFEYISLVNGNLGTPPTYYQNTNQWARITDYPNPSITPTYVTNSIVGLAGQLYRATATTTGVLPPAAPWSTTTNINPGAADGWAVTGSNGLPPALNVSIPMVFNSCKAYLNKGVPFATAAGVGNNYSAGFYIRGVIRGSLTDCEALDNVYGILLQNCDRCTVRDCRSDNNIDTVISPGTGEGFTDLGPTGTAANPAVSTSFFENNTAYMNGTSPAAGPGVGPNLNYNVFYAAGLPLPTVRATLSTATYTFNNGPAFAGVPIYTPNYNLSTVQ
jgi:parallel beta-helix repeat protein